MIGLRNERSRMFRGLSSVKRVTRHPHRSQDMNRKDWTLGDGVADGVPI
jgi:hypothetical protein